MFYTNLASIYYDAFFPHVDEQELAFWRETIQSSPANAPALELGVGTGRIFLPLLKEGLKVEGVDNAVEMLTQCQEKAAAQHLFPILYEQHIETLDLPKKYGCIYSPLGTWQQIAEHAAAQQALVRCLGSLVSGGKLVVYTYLPWYNAPEFGQWHAHEPVITEQGLVQVNEKAIHDPYAQIVYVTYTYTLVQHEKLIAQERKEMRIRWYSHYELVMMFERAGFVDIHVQQGYQDNGPQDVFIITGYKP